MGEPLGSGGGFVLLVQGLYGAGGDSVYLSPAPLYHAAPAGWTAAMHRLDATTVIMDRFDPVEVRPRSVVFVDALPRVPTGKLAKRMLPASVLAPEA